jgi:hypothetical protein
MEQVALSNTIRVGHGIGDSGGTQEQRVPVESIVAFCLALDGLFLPMKLNESSRI